MNNLKAKVICAGNCPVCNKPLKDGECIFMCNECKIKNEIFMELEKIKGEIIACTQQEEGEVPACINYGIKLSTEIVEKHIAELKGENKC